MKIKATQDAWYRKKKIREGQIVDYKEPEVPCWGTLADGEVFVEEKKKAEENKKAGKDEDEEEIKEQEEQDGEDEDEDESEGEGDSENKEGDEEQDEPNKSDAQLEKELELIRDLAVENDVWVEIPDNCTAKEETELIKKELVAKGIKLNF